MKKLEGEIEKKVKNLGEKVEKDRTENEKNGFKRQTVTEKICPFMSSPNEQVACTPQCKIHRADKKGFECIFSELVPISFNMSKIRNYIKNYLGLKD